MSDIKIDLKKKENKLLVVQKPSFLEKNHIAFYYFETSFIGPIFLISGYSDEIYSCVVVVVYFFLV